MNRGSVSDLVLGLAIVFILGASMVLGLYIHDTVQGSLKEDPDIKNETIEKATGPVNEAFMSLDSMVPFIFFGIGILAIILAYRLPSHPIFLFASIFMIIVLLLISAVFSNTYVSLVSNGGLSETAAEFTFTSLIMQHSFKLTLVFGFLVVIAAYISSNRQRGGAGI